MSNKGGGPPERFLSRVSKRPNPLIRFLGAGSSIALGFTLTDLHGQPRTSGI